MPERAGDKTGNQNFLIDIGGNECLYYCFPKEGDVVAKTRLATEELYKFKTGLKARMC